MKNSLSFIEIISSRGETTFILKIESMELLINKEEAMWFKKKLEKALSEDEHCEGSLEFNF